MGASIIRRMSADSPYATSLYSVAQVQALERYAIDELGIPGYELMCRAARSAFDFLLRRWPDARRIVVLCGSGNNGGDGYALATLLRRAQVDVRVIALAPPRSDSEVAQALADWFAAKGVVLPIDASWPKADVYVDALFGVGLSRGLDGLARAWTERLNSFNRPVLALDVPSGVNADTGFVPGTAVRATATLTFVAGKRGLHTGAAPDHCGDIVLDTLQLPDILYTNSQADARLLDASVLRTWLTPRQRDANKGLFGHVLAIGGDVGMGGAIRLTAEAALRVGAGLVSVATQAEHVTALNAARPELMAHAVSGIQELQAMLHRASVIAIGPGLGQRAWGHSFWRSAIAAGKPLVLDADALNLLAREPLALPNQAILTPHPGEAARLLGNETGAIALDRFAAVRGLAQKYRAVVILKGAGTLIANPQGEVAVCPWGNPGMSTAGMGDVLTGIIAGLLAQGFDPWRAAQLGVALHAQAGDTAALAGETGLIASDLFAPLRHLRNGLAVQ